MPDTRTTPSRKPWTPTVAVTAVYSFMLPVWDPDPVYWYNN
jgi:hypothetical protein